MGQRDTERTDYWERFLKTGSVADYLNYTASSAEEHVPVKERESTAVRAEEKRELG